MDSLLGHCTQTRVNDYICIVNAESRLDNLGMHRQAALQVPHAGQIFVDDNRKKKKIKKAF